MSGKQLLSLEEIALKICALHDICIEEVRRRGRSNLPSMVRKLICYTANRKYHIATVEIAHYFGITSPAVSMVVTAGEVLAKDGMQQRLEL